MRPEAVWAGLIGAPVALELWAFATQRQNWMLSPYGRRWLRTDTSVGRAVVTVGFGAGATWLAHHLMPLPTEVTAPPNQGEPSCCLTPHS